MSLATVKIPEAIYSCSDQSCADVLSYSPEQLRYWKGTEEWPEGFYCTESCLDECLSDHYGVGGTVDYDNMVGPALNEVLRDVVYVEVSREQYDLAKELEQKHLEERQAQGLSEEPPVEGAKRIILRVRKD